MIFHHHWEPKGHTFGTCMSHNDSTLMYVNIPKNASSWTKPNLKDFGWEFYNYHTDHMYHKHAIVVLRDPVERWLSGVAEYFALYHRNIDTTQINQAFIDLVMDQITLDDHTEKQVYFIDGLDPGRCTFFMCDHDYRLLFCQFLANQGIDNTGKYKKYKYQHTTEDREDGDTARSKFKEIFQPIISEPKYLNKVKQHYKLDYELISKVNFFRG